VRCLIHIYKALQHSVSDEEAEACNDFINLFESPQVPEVAHQTLKSSGVLPPHSQGSHSKNLSGCLKLQIAPSPVYTLLFLYIHTYGKVSFIN
jgi:hypothetical protein